MSVQTVEILFIAALLVYIIYLNIQLTKKNFFIETTVKRLSGIEKSRNLEEMLAFLSELQKLNQYRSYFSDNFIDDRTLSFIVDNERDFKTYIHYTKEKEDANSILKDGFRFAESFYKTAVPVSKDKLDLIIKHNSRKFYGEYLIVIIISNDVANFYSLELEKAGIRNFTFENVLTENPPVINENSDLIYQLPRQFIKGYINHVTGEIFKNDDFDPWFNSPSFMKNVGLLKNS
jgi:hypothetical protein